LYTLPELTAAAAVGIADGVHGKSEWAFRAVVNKCITLLLAAGSQLIPKHSC